MITVVTKSGKGKTLMERTIMHSNIKQMRRNANKGQHIKNIYYLVV